MDEIFERFKRGDPSRNTEGSGLGLAIAKSIVELQGGQLRIDIDGDYFKVRVEFGREAKAAAS
ncbi:ATP-binding protein [Paenibacillus ehimensis]|uniref:ATP-binding protein n=1 Tax=Paenibacillus ehimensis TaxID=79264 RepID=UPI003898FA7F